MLAERKPRLELFLQCVDAQRLQPPRLGPEPGRVRQPPQRRTAPERQRHGHGGGARTRVAFAQRRARLPQRLLETQRVHPRVGERVSISGGDDRVLAERGAQPRHVMLQRVARRRRQLLSPERIDQLVDRDDPPATKREHCQQAVTPAPAHAHRPSAYENLERAENPDFQGVRHARSLRSKGPVSHPRPGMQSRRCPDSSCGKIRMRQSTPRE
jgi:hypothetical protein